MDPIICALYCSVLRPVLAFKTELFHALLSILADCFGVLFTTIIIGLLKVCFSPEMFLHFLICMHTSVKVIFLACMIRFIFVCKYLTALHSGEFYHL